MQDELIGRVRVLETKVADHEKKLDKQQERNDSQTELNTLLKMQIEASKEQSRTMQNFEATLVKVNDNLTHLNSKQELLDERVTGIENTISKQSFNIIDVIKYIAATIFGLAVGYFSMKLGLK